jgi:alkylation response protein AidB-like acyl-CoA dehydrogenase
MDFSISEDQQRLRAEIIDFAQNELNQDVVLRDVDGTFSSEAWKRCAGIGIQGLTIPEGYGGSEADPLTVMLAMEALGYGCTDNGLIFSLNAHMWSCQLPIVRFGTPEQKARYLPGMNDGSLIGVQAMTEPGSGSDAFSLSTTAHAVPGGYALTGTKTFITNAPLADVFVLFATTDRKIGFAGISAFLVDRDAPGLSVGSTFHKMGLRTSPMAEVVLDGCFVPEERLLGPVGAGMAVFNNSMAWERSCILASAVGTMQRQVERCVAYARDRQQFGQPIGKFQAVSHRIVDMKVRLETSRLLLYRQGWSMSSGRPAAMDAAMVKLYISECFQQSSLDALQVHGGYGYMTEYELEREVRDAIGSRIYSGTSDMQRNVIAGQLGL